MIDDRSNLLRAWRDVTDPDAGAPVRLISAGFILSYVLMAIAIVIGGGTALAMIMEDAR